MSAKDRPARGGRFPGDRPCAHPGCPEAGEYRAPVRRPGSAFAPPSGPPEWQYFCLAHVRAFNARWNYFEGMSAEEIWQAQSPYPQWSEEAAAFARHADPRRPAGTLDDPLGVLRWRTGDKPRAAIALSAEDRRALAVLGLSLEASLAEVKQRFRQLVRRYHPDSNGGDRSYEERLQETMRAHAHLAESSSFRASRDQKD
ncbi:MAG: DnaJ domain-containing protein [Sphingomonadaceae bacterium]